MGGRRLPVVELDDAERAELKALTSRRKTGQALALQARIARGSQGTGGLSCRACCATSW